MLVTLSIMVMKHDAHTGDDGVLKIHLVLMSMMVVMVMMMPRVMKNDGDDNNHDGRW